MHRCKIGVVGVGHLGQAHARILAGLPEVELVGVVDTNSAQADVVAERCHTRSFDHHRDLAEVVDAACIVTPTVFHHSIAADFLSAGIPVLVEKPLALTRSEADDLVQLARQNHAILQVGHIERFNPAFEELRTKSLHPVYIEAERHGTFTGRSTDIGAVLDLMIHDLDLLLDLVCEPVVDVQAQGMTVFGRHEDMAGARLCFANGCVAHLTASRMCPKPKRKMRIWAPEGYAGIDFCDKRLTLVEPSDDLRRDGLDVRGLSPDVRRQLPNQVFAQHLKSQELSCSRPTDQLTEELQDFVRCVRTGAQPRVSGEAGRDAVALAERIIESLNRHVWNGVSGPVAPDFIPAVFSRPPELNSAELVREAA